MVMVEYHLMNMEIKRNDGKQQICDGILWWNQPKSRYFDDVLQCYDNLMDCYDVELLMDDNLMVKF